jgi:Transposase DDE domain
VQRLRQRRIHGGLLEDWLVRAGTGATAPRQLLRYIRWRRGGTRYEVLTNVLAPVRLSAEEALDLYPYRWGVERMFFDLKEVLNLNRLYAANPHAVAMQVYAAAIVYNALRVAQSDGAAQVGWAPERLSPAKFFPKVATATSLYLHRQQWEREIRTRYRRLHLRLVGDRRCWVRTTAAALEVEHRDDHRRTRRFCPARRRWKSLAHVRGGQRFTKLS